MSDLLERIEDLPPEKRELLLQRLKEKRKGVSPLQITRQPRDTNQFPVSFAQQRLWFLDQFESDSSHYNINLVYRLSGWLDVDALEQSFQTILSRHEALRTTFAVVNGQPVQIVGAVSKFKLPLVDLQNTPQAERGSHARQLAQDEGRHPFDLAVGPLLRIKLLRLAREKHFLLLTLHHIITDGWSTGILLRELSALYSAAINQHECLLPDLSIQYVDFAAWQQQWLQGDVLEKQLSYWREHLDSIPTALALPTDHARPPILTFGGDYQDFSLSPPVSAALKKLSQQEGATLFMTLLAAFQVLLYRYSQQDDIVVGTPIANRNRAEIEGLIGFFVNTLVMRSNLAGEPSVLELLAQVKDTALSAYAHQDVPFEKLVQELEPERDLSRPPLFQVMFVLQNMPGKPPEFSGLKVDFLPAGLQTSMFDLTMYLSEYNGQINGSIEYNSDLFEAATIERLVQHFQILLQGIVADPTTSISALPILSPTEYHQVVQQWNDTRADFPDRASIHRLFELQVERSPEAVAVIDDGQQLTYRELNSRANQLAHFLQTKGLAATDLVGVCLERSAETVVALLAVLKTGAAYVPLDPAYPRERLAFMLGDAQVSLLLTSEALSEVLPEQSAQTVYMDAQWQTIAQADESNLAVTAPPESPAYVLYTSGSTGTPKGVVGRHRGAVNRFAWMWEKYPFAPHEVCCQKTSLNFVDSVWEIFGPLLQGVPTVIIPNQLLTDPPLLVGFLAQHQVTRMVLVPSLLRVLLETYDDLQDRLPQLTHWICSGEALSLELYNRFQAVMPQSTLVNLYGSSEVAADVTCFDTRLMPPEASSVPIGRPIANTQLHILDRHLRPVPIGVPAELYVGGAGLAQGYLNRPDLTEERFIPNPFGRESGARLYKTGDIVRYLPDGNLEFLGRVDDQVKVRGYRIELGEIETALSQHPDVQEAAVVVREDPHGEKRLVGYVVPTHQGVSLSELRRHLKQTLPDYMVPAYFATLGAFPLTPNGKVDRRALPDPDGSWSDLNEDFVPPRNPEEATLARILEDLLGVEQVGVHDNFFELGGHSLLATQAVSRAYKAFEIEVPLRAFFENPTIAGIADFLAKAASASQPFARPQLAPVPREGQPPLSFAQERLWLLDQLDPGGTAYSMPAAFRLSGQLNVSALEESLGQLLQRHEVLRTHYAFVKEEVVQVITSGGNFSLPIVDLKNLSSDEQEPALRQQIQEEKNRPFDLGQGPLFRVTLIRLGPTEHVLLLVLHHSIADGLSISILYRELAADYEAACQGKAGHQRPLPVQYADYAMWQRQWLQGTALDALLTYWTGQLADAPRQLDLPTDFPRPPVQTHRGGHHVVQLPESVVSSLRALGQSEGVTMFMSVLTVFALVLSRHTGQEDIVVGTPVANRPRPELEGMIGLFLNTLVLRTKLSGDPTMRGLLQRVREVCLGAYAHQELPFEKLVEALQPERDMSRTPLFQVFLNLIDLSETSLDLPGLAVTPLKGEAQEAKFDFTLYVFLTGTSATVRWSYNRDLFDASTIAWMAEHFHAVLTHLPEHLDHPISSVSLLREEDRDRLSGPTDLVGPSEPFVAFPETALHRSIPARFEEQAHKRPDQVAVRTERYQWTYEELNRRANQIAHTLLSRGLPADARVALLCAHDGPMVAAVFGVLKAGYTYVPLDPSFPAARLETIVTDSGALALLTESTFLPLARELGEAAGQVLTLDDAFAQADASDPGREIDPDALAYVLFTSGTTGVPKGVMQSHRHVLHHIRVYTNNLHLRAEDRLTLLAPYGFDAAVMDLYGALLNGATLYPLDLRQTDPAIIPAWMADHAITIYHSTPTVYRYWVKSLAEGPNLPTVRLVVLGGEVATRADFEAYLKHFGPDCLLVNGLGPTESTVSLQFLADHSTKIIGQTTPVGYPVEHTELALLDQDGRETDVYGEIAIRSPYVAVGYWNQPELTRKAFDLPAESGGVSLYRTGDMGRRRFDGSLEFMGRKDTQVKIRGFRIEAREIEFVLGQHPAIGEAVVVTGEDRAGDTHLLAYLVSDERPSPSISDLRSFMKQKLPDYMIPSAFVFLDALPRTPNGKVDHRSLPKPELERYRLETQFVEPSTPVEKALAEIWGGVLALERVGVHDNFFELGGHSLHATQVMARTRDNFELELPLLRLFETPTIAGFAELIETIRLADRGPLSHRESIPSELEEEEGEL